MRSRRRWPSSDSAASGPCRAGSSATPCSGAGAWEIAEQLGWGETYDAEYVALAQLQADAFVTLDAELARRVEGVVPTATLDALRAA